MTPRNASSQHQLFWLATLFASLLLFVPFLGQVNLFDWDEINFAECAREMIATGDYLRIQIDYVPFWEKPPLFIWLQAASMRVFGIGAFAARLPNALVGVATLLTLYGAGCRIGSRSTARWWVLLYAASWLPHFYFKSGIIDPLFNYFIFLAFFALYRLRYTGRPLLVALCCGLALGLAVLTKGPVAGLIAGLCLVVYMVCSRGLGGYRVGYLLLVAVSAFVPFALWFGLAVAAHGLDWGITYMTDFLVYQVRLFQTEDADHGGPFFYHFIVLLVGCFPASPFLFQFLRRHKADDIPAPQRQFTLLMWILFWVTLILFSIVRTKIVHYSSLCYFPLTWLAAVQVARITSGAVSIHAAARWTLYTVGFLLALLITALPLVGIYKHLLIPLLDDPFAVGNLQAPVVWTYAEAGWGLAYALGLVLTFLWLRKLPLRGMIALVVTQLLIMQVTILHFTPKIEAYTQRAAIEFFKSQRDRDVYIQPLGYKSYAHLFYAEKMPVSAFPPGKDETWLLSGPVDKPAYFICKRNSAAPFRAMPQLLELYERNGFVFFERR
jgi:4-amino-4-deoxy-L-arabinose transferase-like glycosyltransferase